MSGPLPKPPERRQRRNKRPTIGSVTNLPAPADHPEPPAPAKDWLAGTKTDWSALWAHVVANTFDRALHEPVLRRLFDLRDERERYRRVVRTTPIVEGSQGQPVLNPLRAQMAQIDSELRQLEDRFGLNISSLLKLGINYGQARKSLDELTRGLYGDDEDEGPGDDVDPRIIEATVSEKPTA